MTSRDGYVPVGISTFPTCARLKSVGDVDLENAMQPFELKNMVPRFTSNAQPNKGIDFLRGGDGLFGWWYCTSHDSGWLGNRRLPQDTWYLYLGWVYQ